MTQWGKRCKRKWKEKKAKWGKVQSIKGKQDEWKRGKGEQTVKMMKRVSKIERQRTKDTHTQNSLIHALGMNWRTQESWGSRLTPNFLAWRCRRSTPAGVSFSREQGSANPRVREMKSRALWAEEELFWSSSPRAVSSRKTKSKQLFNAV